MDSEVLLQPCAEWLSACQEPQLANTFPYHSFLSIFVVWQTFICLYFSRSPPECF